MRCPTCVQKKDPHYVYRVQRVPTTKETTTMWDNDDMEHIHNPNIWVTDYRCTHGHTLYAARNQRVLLRSKSVRGVKIIDRYGMPPDAGARVLVRVFPGRATV
jgi:hypothetical protein